MVHKHHHHHPAEILQHLLIPQMLVVMLEHIHQTMMASQGDPVVAAEVMSAAVQVLELRDKEILVVGETLLVEILVTLVEAAVVPALQDNQQILEMDPDLKVVMDFNTHNLMHH
jgi:hypothetical protein